MVSRSVALLRTLSCALLLAACRVQSPGALTSIDGAVLAPGIRWWRSSDAKGPWRMTVVEVDLTRRQLQLRAVHARDGVSGRETPSSMFQRATRDSLAAPRVAINADFFDLRSGRSENNQVTDGEWWVGRMVTDSPFDTYDNVHSQFAVSHDGRGSIDRYVLDGRAWGPRGMLPVLGVNHAPGGTYEGSVLYTSRHGERTPRDTIARDSATAAAYRVAEVVLQAAGRVGDTLRYVVVNPAVTAGGTRIPPHGAVLSATGDRTPAVQSWNPGDTVRVWLGTWPRLADNRPPQQLLGGWPRVLAQGVNIAAEASIREGTISRNAEARHPRSAVGVSRDGRTVWLFVVDGRSAASVGMTLVELGEAMRKLGAWDALNFDGGGSTTLVVDGRVINTPTDATGERAVANALLVLEQRKAP